MYNPSSTKNPEYLSQKYTRSSRTGNTPNDPKPNLNTLTVKSTLYTQNTYPRGTNFGPFCSTISHFRDTTCTRLVKIRNAPIDPNWTWTLDSQKYYIYAKYLSLKSKFWSVSLYDKPFPRYNMCKASKNRKCSEWPQTKLEGKTVKPFYIHYILTTEVQIFICFTLRLAISEMQGRQKSEMYRVTPNWTWTLNSQKYRICTKYLPLRPKFWYVSLHD